MNDTKLKKCPFCKGSAFILKSKGKYGGVTYQAVCRCCSASYPPHITGLHMWYHGERNVFVTDKMAINAAITQWNTRGNENI